MPGSGMDRANTGMAGPGHEARLRPFWVLRVTLLLAWWLPGMVRGQVNEPVRKAVSAPRAEVSIETFPLEPAPTESASGRAGASPIAEPRPKSNRLRPSPPRPSAGVSPAAAPVGTANRPESATDPLDPVAALDLTSLRAETAQRIKLLDTASTSPGAGEKASARTANSAAVREILVERQARLDESDLANKELRELNHPESRPEQLAALGRAELERVQSSIAQASPQLPAAFRGTASETTDASRSEMKRSIEAVKTELKDYQGKLETARGELAKAPAAQQSLRAERDRLFQEVATLKASSQDRLSAVTAIKTAEARLLAQERLINEKLKIQLAEMRLKVAEARLDREQRLGEVRELSPRVLEAHIQALRKTVDRMQVRYRELAESQERDLKRAAATQEDRARESDDPLDRFRARRLAELLGLEAKIIKNEQALAAGTRPDLEEERARADRALADFAQIKQLLDDGNLSRLDALRLTNDFKRIGPERERLLRNELAAVEAQLQYYENGLTSVELALIEDSLIDQAEHDAVLDRLEPGRHDKARVEFAALEQQHRTLMIRQKSALTGLVARAAQTLEQVTRRRRAIEDEYGFIRTHLFWVRDQEPLGLATVVQAGREVKRLIAGLFKLVGEATTRKLWGDPSTEFLSAAVAALVLPLGLFRVRRLLRRRITRALPPSHLHGHGPEVSQTGGPTVHVH